MEIDPGKLEDIRTPASLVIYTVNREGMFCCIFKLDEYTSRSQLLRDNSMVDHAPLDQCGCS